MSTESPTNKQLTRLGICEVCNKNAAKYTCPKCEVKTCCLQCNQIHKTELECNGLRDRTKFIPIPEFTNLDLLSDYRLLEETQRFVHTTKRQRGPLNYTLPNWCWVLRNVAFKKKRIHLKYLPRSFTKHRSNTTILNYNTKEIEWHVEWIFINADSMIRTSRLPESTKLATALNRHLNSDNKMLQFYQAAGLSGICLLLKSEEKSKNAAKLIGGQNGLFYKLDMNESLGDNLRGKTIIEYPVIHVVLQDQVYCYDIVETDDDDEMEQSRVQHGGNSKFLGRTPQQNLLFTNETD